VPRGSASRPRAGRRPDPGGCAVLAAGGGQIPADALRGYGVDASLMSSWLHGGGIHIESGQPGPVLVMPV
jgi:hypothetical protein